MKSLLLLLALALPGIAGAQALPSKTHAIGVCNPQTTQSVLHLFATQKPAPAFDLYVFCQAEDWRHFLDHFSYPLNTLAFTDWKHGRIYLGPTNIDDPVNLRQTIGHELDHLRCACLLGEQPH